jgi:deoxyribonuclease V
MELPPLPDLPHCLAELVRQVPVGRVATCGQLAEALGHRAAALWIADWSLNHEHDEQCCCHRVVRAIGLGDYIAGGQRAKARRLRSEGVVIGRLGIDLARFGFHAFHGEQPLKSLLALQESLARRVSLTPPKRFPRLVGGVDVAYPAPGQARGAYALVDAASGEMLWSLTIRRPVSFPYITSFLSFRELPVHVEILRQVREAGRMADVLMVDGTGILHPRRAGIASHLGVLADLPTIGVSKKRLFGQVDCTGLAPGESRPVSIDEEPCGVALRPTAGSLRPIFISPGHRMSVRLAEQLVRDSLVGRRLPAAIYWADRLSKGRDD